MILKDFCAQRISLYNNQSYSSWKEKAKEMSIDQLRNLVNNMIEEIENHYLTSTIFYPHRILAIELSAILFSKEAQILKTTVYKKTPQRLNVVTETVINSMRRRYAIYKSGLEKIKHPLSQIKQGEEWTMVCANHGETFLVLFRHFSDKHTVNPCCGRPANATPVGLEESQIRRRPSIEGGFKLNPLQSNGISTPQRWLKSKIPSTLIKAPIKYFQGPSKSVNMFHESVRNQYNYTCPITGSNKSKELEFHHFYNLTDFPYLGYIPANGLYLSKRIHNAFHSSHVFYQTPVTIDHFICYSGGILKATKLSIEAYRSGQFTSLTIDQFNNLQESVPRLARSAVLKI
jgi:hypothetical protein